MRPFLVPIEVQTEIKKYFQQNNALHCVYIMDLRAWLLQILFIG